MYFNPRSREGSDVQLSLLNPENKNFNPRSREGSDFPAIATEIYTVIFQSTLPRGERRMRGGVKAALKNFNPRSREGSDGR